MSIISALNPFAPINEKNLGVAKKIAYGTSAVLITSVVLSILASCTHVFHISSQNYERLFIATSLTSLCLSTLLFVMWARIKEYQPPKKTL